MFPDQAPAGVVQKTVGYFGDAAILLALVWLLPLVIVVVGAPVALLGRLLLEIAKRF